MTLTTARLPNSVFYRARPFGTCRHATGEYAERGDRISWPIGRDGAPIMRRGKKTIPCARVSVFFFSGGLIKSNGSYGIDRSLGHDSSALRGIYVHFRDAVYRDRGRCQRGGHRWARVRYNERR